MSLPAPWKPVPSEPPDVSATPQARLVSWNVYAVDRGPEGARLTVGCFGFQLSGYTDELSPIVFERTEAFVARAAGGVSPSSVLRSEPDVRAWPHRQTLRFETPDARPGRATMAFGFTDGELLSCFAVCRETLAPNNALCGSHVESAAFTVPLTAAPAPTWAQSVALGVLAEPRGAALGLALALVSCAVALLFSRGSRA
ncbi:hypothetical protein EON77_12090 [bacterium]|nr:MAG: hypothetical protein EON77_12090 [bacterium]